MAWLSLKRRIGGNKEYSADVLRSCWQWSIDPFNCTRVFRQKGLRLGALLSPHGYLWHFECSIFVKHNMHIIPVSLASPPKKYVRIDLSLLSMHCIFCLYWVPPQYASDCLVYFLFVLTEQTVWVKKKSAVMFKYIWKRGLHGLASGYELCHMSRLCVDSSLSSLPAFILHSLSRRRSLLTLRSLRRFAHCNAFTLSPCCWVCFAAPLHCSPSVKACPLPCTLMLFDLSSCLHDERDSYFMLDILFIFASALCHSPAEAEAMRGDGW